MTLCVVCPVLYPDGEPRDCERPHVCNGCRDRLHRDLNDLRYQTGLFDLTPGRGKAHRVSGDTRSAPLPVKEAVATLAGPGNAVVREPVRYGDQIGDLPVNIWLGEWSMWWGGMWQLEKACDEDLGIADFADELRTMLNAAKAANKDTEPRPDYKLGVPCRRCDTNALTQSSVEDYVECGVCGTLYTPAEYQQWLNMLAAWAKRVRDTPGAA